MLNFRHSIEKINSQLEFTNHKVQKKELQDESFFELLEKTEDGFRVCGIFYKKADLAEIANTLIEKHNLKSEAS